MKWWIKAKWHQLLVLLGIEMTPEWIYHRAAVKVVGQNEADDILMLSLMLEVDFSLIRTKENIKKIIDHTEGKP